MGALIQDGPAVQRAWWRQTIPSVDLELRDAKANTALHYAAGYGRSNSVKALVGAGADVSATNDSGKTPAQLAQLGT